MRYALLNADNTVAATGHCDDTTFNRWVADGRRVRSISDAAPADFDITHFWDGTAFVEFPPAQKAKRMSPPNHAVVWDQAARDWVDVRNQAQKDADLRHSLLQQITALELTQMRSVRELALARGSTVDARNRLIAIDDQIAALRAQLPPTP